ncbi:hypothetical protein BTVI_99621 [Pitangus sulphuratus]|nr:hypothetical protein BTVI_99621 [Pitangus sulphuratus]
MNHVLLTDQLSLFCDIWEFEFTGPNSQANIFMRQWFTYRVRHTESESGGLLMFRQRMKKDEAKLSGIEQQNITLTKQQDVEIFAESLSELLEAP